MDEEYMAMIEASTLNFKERYVIRVDDREIEELMPVAEFRELSVNAQYLLITMKRQIDAHINTIEDIREYLDNAPL
jgi:hypothetical protein